MEDPAEAQSYHDTAKNITEPVVTLGSLYAKDMEDGIFLLEYPSTFNERAEFYNNKKYLIHDNPPFTDIVTQYLEPIRSASVIGNQIPVILRNKPVENLKHHWKKWLPFFPEPDIRDFDISLNVIGDKRFFTQYPLQWLPKENHAIDPDVHHRILSKHAIPLMGANCPRHMTLDDYTVPCMIKASHGAAGRGTYLARTKLEAEQIIHQLQSEFKCPEPNISEVIEDICGNYNVQFYLYITGEIEWLGCNHQDINQEFRWTGNQVNWKKQYELKEKLFGTVMPVKEYLHKNGYFGVVGVDVVSNKDGNYVVDVNARVNGSSSLLFIAPHMAKQGFPLGAQFELQDIEYREVEIIEKFDAINSSGKEIVIDLASTETDGGKTCDVVVCIFARDEIGFKNLHDILENLKK